jgi:lipopolysaccharide/colanic/teichoic acid biosynthesis glycosyltransferase
MVAISVWIKAVSRGPVFFRQERVGYRGRAFYCLKFRSMKVDAETAMHEEHTARLIRSGSPMTKLDANGDPRLIPGGVIFRASGLDELPQILNVIRGEMSLVGPRPCTPKEFQFYDVQHRERINAPPGLTGEWQVNGKNERTFGEMIDMDIEYGRNMSLVRDISILVRTIPAVIREVRKSRVEKCEARKKQIPAKPETVRT